MYLFVKCKNVIDALFVIFRLSDLKSSYHFLQGISENVYTDLDYIFMNRIG